MCDYDHVTIYWLPSNGAIIQCGRKAHAIKAGRTSRVQHVKQRVSNNVCSGAQNASTDHKDPSVTARAFVLNRHVG